MVVLGVSIMTKSGKVLVSRQFVDMSRIRVEGLLSAFPKLVGSGKQHTYIETENVRYVYQPIELLYLLVITNRQSNILEDLETLRLLSKLVPEYSMSLDEEGISEAAFELLFAFDEVITLGHKENVTVAQIKQYCEMDSQEERVYRSMMQDKINLTKDVMKRKVGEIEKNKIDKRDRGLMSLSSEGSGRLDVGFNDLNISGGGAGFGGGGFGLGAEVESISSKYQARQPSSATAPPKGGMQLGKSKKGSQLLESLRAEGETIVEDVQPNISQPRAAAPPPTDPITLTVEEKLDVTLRRDGGVSNFDVQGTLSLQILSQEDGLIRVQIETGGNPSILFKTHPNMNRELFSTDSILGLRDSSRPFPTGPAGDVAGVVLLKWRMQAADESMVPLTVNCWPSVSGNETYVSIEYEASPMFDLCNVLISVPLPALREAPSIKQIDGESRYDPRNSVLEWSVVLIDNSNRSGSMEFVVPAVDSSVFFPISVRFSATSTFSDLKVKNIIPLKGGNAPKFAQRTRLTTENYQVV